MISVATDKRTEIREAILKTLNYYSIFHYPIDAEELYGSCSFHCALPSILDGLNKLEEQKLVYCHKGYYSLSAKVKEQVDRRITANLKAERDEQKARKVGSFLYQFPFVRFVGISGSLSKGFAEDTSDYDFFIVTEENRLWICRTLLHLFKKMTFLFGQQHKFCMNYFIDTHKLELDDKNLFTAIELSSLIPVKGTPTFFSLMNANKWVKEHLPNGYIKFGKTMPVKDNNNFVKRGAEFLMQLLSPTNINAGLMKLTDNKWRKKWERKNYPMQDYDTAFKTTIHISKNHPANHQKKILSHLAKGVYSMNT